MNYRSRLTGTAIGSWSVALRLLVCAAAAAASAIAGCKSPSDYRKQADMVAYDIISTKQVEALGRVEPFTIERPSELLRRRLLEGQGLQISGPWSLGVDRLEKLAHWPDDNYPGKASPDSPDLLDPLVLLVDDKPVKFSLVEALQIGARNSFEYQSEKEDVFRFALKLDLEENNFRDIFGQQVKSVLSSDSTGGRTVSGTNQTAVGDWGRNLRNGASIGAQIAVDLANLLTLGGASSFGITGDASVSLPLLRGSGSHIVTEQLTQAQRDVVYAIWNFETFKRAFAVAIASEYMQVLRQMDQVNNSEANYRSMVLSARTSRRMADAEKLTEIDVGQAVQAELDARDGWVSAMQSYDRSLDEFKNLLGLPTDATIELDRGELDRLLDRTTRDIIDMSPEEVVDSNTVVAADAEIYLRRPGMVNAGPYEIEESSAVSLSFENRLDLKISQGRVYDAQRDVVYWADRLRAELTLLGSASGGARRGVSSAASDDASLRLDELSLSALLTLDLPIERTAERNDYRDSLIDLERSLRSVQNLEDQIKLDIRDHLRSLQSTRESLQTSAKGVEVALKRKASADLFLKAGRTEIRNILEAQNALLRKQNALTAAVISYRITELQLQRDMGLLRVDEKGLWTEFVPEVIKK